MLIVVAIVCLTASVPLWMALVAKGTNGVRAALDSAIELIVNSFDNVSPITNGKDGKLKLPDDRNLILKAARYV